MNIEQVFFAFCKALEMATREAAAAAAERREQIRDEYAAACRRVDEDPRERQRIHDIVDLIEAEDALYGQALAALDRGDKDQALPLLRRTAQAGIGEAAWLLAGLLEERGDTAEAITWYQQAADDGDPRADDKLAALYSRPSPPDRISNHLWLSGTGGHTDDHGRSSAEAPTGRIFVVSGTVGTSRSAWQRELCRHLEETARIIYFVGHQPAVPADPWAVLTARHTASAESTSLWDKAILETLLSDEVVTPHWLTDQLPAPRILVFNACSGGADTGLDLLARDALRDRLCVGQATCSTRLRRLLTRTYAREILDLTAGASAWWAGHKSASELTAADAMTPLALLTILTPDTTVREAMEQMLQADAQALLVGDQDQVAGVVTLADLARRMHDSRGVPSIERVQALMRLPATVEMAAPLSTVQALMTREGSGLVAVTGPGGMTVGCITAQSLLADVAGSADTARPEPPSTRIPLLRPANDLVKVCLSR